MELSGSSSSGLGGRGVGCGVSSDPGVGDCFGVAGEAAAMAGERTWWFWVKRGCSRCCFGVLGPGRGVRQWCINGGWENQGSWHWAQSGCGRAQTGLPLARQWLPHYAAMLRPPLSRSWEEGGALGGGGRGQREAGHGKREGNGLERRVNKAVMKTARTEHKWAQQQAMAKQ